MSEPFRLSPEQKASFFEQGYLSVDQLTTAEDVAALRVSYDRIFAERAGRDEGAQFDLAGTDEEGHEAALPQILGPARYAPEMNDSLLLKNARRLVAQLYDVEAPEVGIAHAIYKPPHHGAETPWHQDAAYWSPTVVSTNISIWVPLQEATLENGCMEFVPRSHLHDVYPHQSINNDPRIHGLELRPEELWRARDYVSCPLPAGGCTIHGGYMLHHTPPNRSSIPRRALILMCQPTPSTPRETPLRFPWMEEKRTARTERAAAAEAAKAAANADKR